MKLERVPDLRPGPLREWRQLMQQTEIFDRFELKINGLQNNITRRICRCRSSSGLVANLVLLALGVVGASQPWRLLRRRRPPLS